MDETRADAGPADDSARAGRPRASRATSRGQTPSRRGGTAVTVAGLAVVVLLAGGGIVATRMAASGDPAPCPPDTAPLRVAAAPSIAAAIAEVARQGSGPGAGSGAGCQVVTVQAVTPEAEIRGLAQGSIQPPDVWVPDSSLWLDRAGVERVAAATNAKSVASSPLVLALPRAVADRLRPPAPRTPRRPQVADLATSTASGTPVSVELSDQRLSPGRVGTILALTAATAGTPDARAALTGILRSATVSTAPAGARLARLSPTASVAVPVSERDVWAANSAGSAARPVAVYTGGVTFDFPYAVLARDLPTVQQAALLFERLRSARGRAVLAGAGFRDSAGAAGANLTADLGVDGATAVTPRPLTPASLADAEKALASVSLDARLLAVVDVSGSMAWGIGGPKSPGPSRLSIAVQAAARGLGLYPDSTEVGLWVFSENLPGGTDHHEVVPVARLGGPTGARAALAAAVTKVAPVPDGDTALYSTTADAVEAMRHQWKAGRVNAVVVLSDGKDTGHHGPTLDQLVAMLAAERGSATPVPVITVAFGPQSDAASLAAISKASGGASYRADTADQVRQIFLDAVGQRACRPQCSP